MADFERDLGYLMPFLERISQAARSADPGIRAELTSLVEGEQARWKRISALLSGAGAAGLEREAPVSAPRVRAGAAPVDDPVHVAVRGFTVGSLRRV